MVRQILVAFLLATLGLLKHMLVIPITDKINCLIKGVQLSIKISITVKVT